MSKSQVDATTSVPFFLLSFFIALISKNQNSIDQIANSRLIFFFINFILFCPYPSCLFTILAMPLSLVTIILALAATATGTADVCGKESALFIYDVKSQCPLSISSNPPLQVDGNFLDRALASNQGSGFTSVLFYASWCPFSHSMRPKFEMLCSMFPEIEHLAVEQSSALPSIYSRHGIHSLPSILIVNQTSKVQYSGPKNLQSLVQFYEKATGLEPVQYLTDDMPIDMEIREKSIIQPWEGSSLEEMMKREPYLVFATLFLFVRVLICLSPKVISYLKTFWGSCIWHFNLEIFGETSQLFGRILPIIDVRRIWTKLTLCKTRNFHERVKNFRVWASSFASVSLGESSSSARS